MGGDVEMSSEVGEGAHASAADAWWRGCVVGLPMMRLRAAEAGPDCELCAAVPSADLVAQEVHQIMTHPMAAADAAEWPPPPPPPLPPAVPRGELVVCALGTGCAVPSKHRAPAAIYLHAPSAPGAPPRGGVLLDVGEGTLGQLVALLGTGGAAAALAHLQLVWISHGHADHHLGLHRLLEAAHSVRPPAAPPLLVVGPRMIGSFLSCATSLQPSASRPRYVFETCAAFNSPRSAGRDQLLRRCPLGLSSLLSVPVHHCADAWGIVLRHASGWSLVYSGDTRPCEALAVAGRGATLLIHEATFEDEMTKDAVAKRHSTRAEALAVAGRMQAQAVLLTHLSSRYSRSLGSFTDAAGSDATRAPPPPPPPHLVAFDLMTIDLADLAAMPGQLASITGYFAREASFREAARQAELAAQLARSEAIERGLEAEAAIGAATG
jgi:ribonuclease Z